MAETTISRPYGRRLNQPGMSVEKFVDFSGGWNKRDAPSEVAANESPDCLNFTLDERGGLVKRLGLHLLSSVPGAEAITNMFYWRQTGDVFVQYSNKIAKSSDLVTWTDVLVLTGPNHASFCDFQGQLLLVQYPSGGFRSSNGSTWTAIPGMPPGGTIVAWQNKVWVAGHNASRVQWSAEADATTWNADDFNDIREKDDAPILALGLGPGMDISGRPGLLAYKAESCYRINDSEDGSYTTLSAAVGAVHSLAITTVQNTTLFVSKRGIFATDGTNAPREVSSRIEPLFRPSQLDFSRLDACRAGYDPVGGRALFSLPLAGSDGANGLTLEYDPQQGWIVPHSYGVSAFAQVEGGEAKVLGAGVGSGKVLQIGKGGSDDGEPISCFYQTRWFELVAGIAFRMRRLLVSGRGDFELYVRTDFTTGQGEHNHVTLPGGGFIWDDPGAIWSDPGMVWGPEGFEDYQELQSLGRARAASFRIEQTGDAAFSAQPILTGLAAAAEVGQIALYGMLLQYVRLGLDTRG